jgi:hypothetical protein
MQIEMPRSSSIAAAAWRCYIVLDGRDSCFALLLAVAGFAINPLLVSPLSAFSLSACASLCVSVGSRCTRRAQFQTYLLQASFLTFFCLREWCAAEGISVEIKFHCAQVLQTPIFCHCIGDMGNMPPAQTGVEI